MAKGVVHSPLRPAAPPEPVAGAARPSLVLSNEKPIVFSRESTPGNFVFQKDSAGLGVPRGSLGNLNKISTEVERHGSASMAVFAAGPNGEMAGSDHGAARGPATLRPASEGFGGQRENSELRQGASQANNQGSTGGQAAPAFHGGSSQPAGGASMSAPSGNSSSGGAHSSAASPK